MIDLPPHALGLAAALGIGLLIGVDREKTKVEGTANGAAGIRTFALAALLGAVGHIAAGMAGLLVALGVVALLAAVAYWRTARTDPGLLPGLLLMLLAAWAGAFASGLTFELR